MCKEFEPRGVVEIKERLASVRDQIEEIERHLTRNEWYLGQLDFEQRRIAVAIDDLLKCSERLHFQQKANQEGVTYRLFENA